MAERAVRASRWKRNKVRGEACLNCGADVTTPFCPHCGQENIPCDLTLAAVLKELSAELVYYDSKLWHTLWALVAYPGKLSSEWSKGRRAHYISPVRLYLSITFIYFVLLSLFASRVTLVNVQTAPSKKTAQEQINAAKARIANDPGIPQKDKSAIEADLDDPDAALRRLGWFGLQMRKLRYASETEAGRVAIQKGFFDQIPKVLFIMLPVFAGVTRLLYWRQRRFYVEHLVFMLHIHSFAFLVLIVGQFAPYGAVETLLFFGVLLYIYVAMLRFYKQPWYLTGFKAGFLGATYLVFLGLGALLATLFLAQSLPVPPDSPPHIPVSAGAKPDQNKLSGTSGSASTKVSGPSDK